MLAFCFVLLSLQLTLFVFVLFCFLLFCFVFCLLSGSYRASACFGSFFALLPCLLPCFCCCAWPLKSPAAWRFARFFGAALLRLWLACFGSFFALPGLRLGPGSWPSAKAALPYFCCFLLGFCFCFATAAALLLWFFLCASWPAPRSWFLLLLASKSALLRLLFWLRFCASVVFAE